MNQLEKLKNLYQNGEYQAALNMARDILQNDRNNHQAQFIIARCLAQLQDFEHALQAINAACGLQARNEQYLQFKGQILMALQRWDEAFKAFQASLRENPNLFYSYLALGDIALLKGQLKRAEKQFKLALKVDSRALPATIRLANLEVLRGDCEAAFSILQQAELNDSQNLELKYQMAKVKLENGESGLAEILLRQVLQQAEHLPAKVYLAICLMEADKQQAAQLLQEVIKTQVKIPEVSVAMGFFYLSEQKYPAAEQFLQPPAQSAMAMPSWIIAYAQSLWLQKRQPEAINVLQQFIDRSNNRQARMFLGNLFQQDQQFKKAKHNYSQIDKGQDLYWQAQLKLAECAYQSNDFEACLQILEKLLKHNRHHATALKLQLNALSKLNKNGEALMIISSIDQQQHDDDFNQLMNFYRGLLSDGIGDYQTAGECFAAVNHPSKEPLPLLSSEQEKVVTGWPREQAETDIVFVFGDAASGRFSFCQWLLDNGMNVLFDRYRQPRNDVFDKVDGFDELQNMDETKIHLLRRKYLKQTRALASSGSGKIVDFIPFSMSNAAIIKRIFPAVQTVILTRNLADFNLHNRVFGVDQVAASEFTKVFNQLIAFNLKLAMIDVDLWKSNNPKPEEQLRAVFGHQIKPFQETEASILEQTMLPYMNWKNYKGLMN